MPLDTFALELACFLCLVKVVASHPTDPYFYPWREGPPSYGMPREPPSFGGGQRNFTHGPGVPEFSAFGYQLEQRGGDPVLREEGFQRRNFEAVAPGGYLGYRNENVEVPVFGNLYSSHAKCGTGNRHQEGAEKTPKNIRENIEPIFGVSVGAEAADGVREKINFEEASRNMRSEVSKGVDVPNPRIVTPKGGRRPSQGSSSKHESKPFNPGPTTEKLLGNQTSKGSKRPRPPGGDIVFPDGYPKKFIPRVSKCARKSTFCENLGEEYPNDYISQVLKKEGALFREFFGRDVISDPNITERINGPEENSLCPFRQEVVFPRAAQNKEDKWLFIINQDQYVQGVTVEVCLNPESRCILTEGFPLGYTPYCKQKYIERRLVAIGEDGKPHSDSFRLPSCCSCVVKHETSARVGPLWMSRGVAAAPPRE